MSLTIAQTTVARWRDLPATVWLLVGARTVNRLGAFTLPFLSVTLVASADASIAEAGLLLATFGVATVPSRLAGGMLADRIGGRATIVAGLLATAVGQLLVAASTSLAQAAVAVVVLGLAFEVYEPPSQSLIADVTRVDQRPVAFGLLFAALAAAGMGAGLLGAVLAGVDLRWLFVADATSCLLCAGLVAWRLPTRSPAAAPEAGPANPWRDRRLLTLLALGTGFAVVYLQTTITLPLTLTARGMSPATLGLLLTVSAATVVAGQPLLSLARLRRLGDPAAMAVGYVVLAAGLVLTGVATSLAAYVVATVVWSLGDLLLMGRAYSLVAAIAPASARGRYLAVYGLSWGLAGIVAPLAGTQLLAHAGPGRAWTTFAALCLLLAALQPLVGRVVSLTGRSSARSATRPG